MHAPASRIEGALGRAAAVLNPYFQIESLYRFNAKFSPSWVPRYLVCESVLALPRVSLAALRAEGQLPAVRLRARPLVHAGHPRA
jgi:lysyl-tRNA synthetase class 2